jgi:hypothetical protein
MPPSTKTKVFRPAVLRLTAGSDQDGAASQDRFLVAYGPKGPPTLPRTLDGKGRRRTAPQSSLARDWSQGQERLDLSVRR